MRVVDLPLTAPTPFLTLVFFSVTRLGSDDHPVPVPDRLDVPGAVGALRLLSLKARIYVQNPLAEMGADRPAVPAALPSEATALNIAYNMLVEVGWTI